MILCHFSSHFSSNLHVTDFIISLDGRLTSFLNGSEVACLLILSAFSSPAVSWWKEIQVIGIVYPLFRTFHLHSSCMLVTTSFSFRRFCIAANTLKRVTEDGAIFDLLIFEKFERFEAWYSVLNTLVHVAYIESDFFITSSLRLCLPVFRLLSYPFVSEWII